MDMYLAGSVERLLSSFDWAAVPCSMRGGSGLSRPHKMIGLTMAAAAEHGYFEIIKCVGENYMSRRSLLHQSYLYSGCRILDTLEEEKSAHKVVVERLY